MTPETFSPELRELLARFQFQRIPLEALRARLAKTQPPEAMHRITEALSPPPAGCAVPLAPEGSGEHQELRREGQAMIDRGELAVVILAGGMATRFGSVVKALSPMFDGHPTRFLDIKLADSEVLGRGVDTTLMTSFATHDAIGRALSEEDSLSRVFLAPQFISLRLRADGGLFRGPSGELSPHAPGHGDLPEALEAAGCLARWKRKGVRTVLMSNVDNVGATVDPAVLALHRRAGVSVSVELVSKRPGDRGGLPVRIDRDSGPRLVLAEAFRLPAGFPVDEFPLFNTNTLWMNLDALEGPMPWTWCAARKQVEGAEAIQLERLVGELTWWHPSQYVHVPRDGSGSRFIPVKDQDDLTKHRAEIDAVMRARVRL